MPQPDQALPESRLPAALLRVTKRLSQAGVCSRRAAERLIAEGRVAVNAVTICDLGHKITEHDLVSVDGRAVAAPDHARLFVFHKPRGLVCTNADPQGRPTVFSVLPPEPRLLCVGRLDINTEGLLLLTTSGALARHLELPKNGFMRSYRVRVHGRVVADALKRLQDGITVEGVSYGAIDAHLDSVQATNAWLTLSLREGKNREIKIVLGALGLTVTRLIRTAFGPFALGDMPAAALREVPVPQELAEAIR